MTDLVGVFAALLTTGAWLPQIRRCWREQSCDDVSWGYLSCMVAGFTLWTVYGLLVGAPAVVACNVASLLLATMLADIKRRSASPPPVPAVSVAVVSSRSEGQEEADLASKALQVRWAADGAKVHVFHKQTGEGRGTP